MWTVCITSIRHVLKLNGYGGPQAKANEKRLRFKGWETLVNILSFGQRYKLPFLISTIVLGVLFVYLRSVRGTLFWINYPFFICFFFSLLVLIATSLERSSVRLHPLLVKSVFFVFALHHMPYFMALPLPWLKLFPSSTLVFVGDYLLTPIIKISLCLLLYIILDKVSPKINGLLSGNRSK